MAFSYYTLICMSVGCCILGFAENTASPECEFDKKHIRIATRHIEAGGLGYNEGYTTLEAFVAPRPSTWKVMPFLDVRGHIFNNGKWAANAGFGIRSMLGCRVYGINAYYDYRQTKRDHYNQIGVGLETLGRRWDFRANGYLPVGSKLSDRFDQSTSLTDATFNSFSENFVVLKQTQIKKWKKQYVMQGLDGEAAYHFLKNQNFDLYAAAGPYYYTYKDKHAMGGKARLGALIYECAFVELINSYDSRFHENFQGQIGLSIPLGRKPKVSKNRNICRNSCLLSQRLIQNVQRQEIPVVDQFNKSQTTDIFSYAINPETGNPYFLVFVENTSSSLGTFESPYPSLVQAQENSLPGQIIYVFPGDGTTSNMDRGIVLQMNQKLWGSSIAHTLPTTLNSVVIPQMSTKAPQVTNIDLLGAGVTLSTNNEISGITFTQTSGQAIFGTDPVTVNLSSCTFSACGQGDRGLFPVLLQASSPFTATVKNNNFIDNPNGGVFVKLLPGASSTQITMNNNEASNNQGTSGGASLMNIEAHGAIGACTLTMMNNVYKNNGCGAANITDFDSPHEGSFTSFQGIFLANTFTDNLQGITFATNAESCKMTIKENDFSNNTNGSIVVLAGAAGTQLINNSTIVIDSNQINQGGSGGDAITISPAGDTISISIKNNSIKNNSGSGFVSYFNQPGPNATLSISNNIIANNLNLNSNASGGISFDEFSAVTALIENNSFDQNAQGNSIGFYGGSVVPDTSSVTFTNNQLSGNDTFTFKFFGDAPAVGCLTISGNTSTTDPTYTFEKNSSGSCFIVPCNYEAENTGGFNINLSDVTPSLNCSGNACP